MEIIIVATTHKYLAPITIAAIQNGKHVLCEKPLARDPEEGKAVLDAASTNQVKVKTGFNHRYHPGIKKARELFEKGAIGDIHFARCRYGHGARPGYEKEWRADPDLSGGGELLDQGIHAIDLFRWFMGEFSQVTGFLTTRYWKIVPLEDNAFALLKTQKGQVASLHASWTQWKNLFSFEIFGQDGYLIIDGLGRSYGTERLTVGKRLQQFGPPSQEVFEFGGPDHSWREEWQDFISAIREDRQPLANVYDGWQALRITYGIYQAAENGSVVEL